MLEFDFDVRVILRLYRIEILEIILKSVNFFYNFNFVLHCRDNVPSFASSDLAAIS